MSRRPAAVTQATVARVVRAAKQARAAAVEIAPNGTIRVLLSAPSTVPEPPAELVEREIIL